MDDRATVLLVTTCKWHSAARLALAFNESGSRVEIVCPRGHPVKRTRIALKSHAFNGLRPLGSFLKAIAASKPKLIIPCDDLAAVLLTKLYRRLLARNSDEGIIQVLELSIGGPSTQSARCSRTELMELAVAEGIRTAETAVVGSVDELREWTTKMGLPCALKADGTSGGVGVKIVSSFGEAESAFRKLAAPPLILRAVKRAIVDLDTNLVVPCLRRQTSAVSIQRFVGGRETTCTIASWKGNVLANLSFEVLQTWEAKGPASVLRSIDNREMSSAAELLARRLNLSGIYGFDFVLDEATGHPYLIEMNARATQTSYLALGPKRDLAAAICAALSGKPVSNRRRVTANDVIVLFPVEWKRDPASPFFSSGYHDVPWSEPGLVKTGILNRYPNRLAYLRRKYGRKATSQAGTQPQEWVPPQDMVPIKRGIRDS